MIRSNRSKKRSLLRLFETESGKLIRSFDDHQRVGFNSLAFTPDGRWLIAGEGDRQNVRIWDPETGQEVRRLKHEQEEVQCVAISPDGTAAWAPSKQDNIKRGQLRDGQFLTHDSTVRSISSRIAFNR